MLKEVVFVVWGMFFFLVLENGSSQSGQQGLHGSGDYGKVRQRFKPWNGLTSPSKLKEKSTYNKGKEGKGGRKGKEKRPKTVPTTSQSSTPPQPPLTTQPTAAPTTGESSTAPTDIQKTPKFSPGFYEVAAAFLGRKRNIAFSQGKGNKHGNKFKSSQSSSSNDAGAGISTGAGDYSPAFQQEGRSMNLENNPDALLEKPKVETEIEPTQSTSSNDNKFQHHVPPKRPGDYSFAFNGRKREGRSMNLKNNPDTLLGKTKVKTKSKPTQSSSSNNNELQNPVPPRRPGDYSFAFNGRKREGRSMNLEDNPDTLLGETKVETEVEPTQSSSSNNNKVQNLVPPRSPGDYSFAFNGRKREGRSMNLNPGAQLGNKRRKTRIKDKKLPGDYGDFFVLWNITDNATGHKNNNVKPDRVKIPAPSFQSKKPVKPIGGGHFGQPLAAGNYMGAVPFVRNRVVWPPIKSRAKKNKKEEPNKTY